jgi:hypothetical protein
LSAARNESASPVVPRSRQPAASPPHSIERRPIQGRPPTLLTRADEVIERIAARRRRHRCLVLRLSHRNQALPLASRGDLDAIRNEREHRPCAME